MKNTDQGESSSVSQTPIQFLYILTAGGRGWRFPPVFRPAPAKIWPGAWDNVELLVRNYDGSGFDLMLGFNDDRDAGSTVFAGYYNDGIIDRS